MPGTVVTFYSYKGGVGRSFAVANAAVILAQWGARVLLVDWDIEAPGLNHYFAQWAPSLPAGVLNFIDDCTQQGPRSWDAYATIIELGEGVEPLHLMPAAAGGGVDFTDRVQRLDWDELFDVHNLGAHLEALRAEWVGRFDFVLVDSRTGVTDFSGLTTAQLPDALAFLFTANAQSLEGCTKIAMRALEARRRMPVDRPAVLPLPIPARFEQREEYERAQAWRARFAAELAPFLDVWKPREADGLKLVDLLTIPYVPRWTFGEELAALQELAGTTGARTPGQAVTYALETIAALLVHRLGKADLLVSSRDEYVHAARATVQSWKTKQGLARIFISYARRDRAAVNEIARVLDDAHFATWIDQSELDAGAAVVEATRRAVEQCDAYVVLVGPDFSRWQESEVEVILRHSLRSEQRKPIVPVVLPGGEKALAGSRLGDFAAASVDPDKLSMEEQIAPVITRLEMLRR